MMTTRQSEANDIGKKIKSLLKDQVAKPRRAKESAEISNGLRDHISVRAYALYEERGYRQGCDLQDWLDAEREILSRQPAV